LAKREEKEKVLSSERAHKQVLTVKKNMHLIQNSSTGTLVTIAISTAPDGGFHSESMRSQVKPAHIPHNMLREIKVQIARRSRHLRTSEGLTVRLVLSDSISDWQLIKLEAFSSC